MNEHPEEARPSAAAPPGSAAALLEANQQLLTTMRPQAAEEQLREGARPIPMPGADGGEAASRLGTLPETSGDVLYVAVTGFAQPDDFRRSEEAGFAHHLVKPVAPNELDQILRPALVRSAAAA